MDPNEFNDLLRKFKSDSYASRKLFTYLYPKIRLHIAKNFRNINAEDVAQDFFVKLLKMDLRNMQYIRFPASWVYKITDNLAKSQLAKAYEKNEVACADIDIESSDNEYDKLMRRDEVKEFMDKLDVIDREIFYDVYWEGYNLREVSDLLQVKYSFVKQRHSRVLKKLKNFLIFCNQNEIASSLISRSEVKE